ncbi:hypothetical protein HYT84_03530 [Candidatus Micrarchaeota archaeon]|nr:hypothetical protein [Candidatus Micrarchaeota archaeon]
MVRCIFSNTEIADFRWKHGSHYVCFCCHQTRTNEGEIEERQTKLLIEEFLKNATAVLSLKGNKLPKKQRLRRIKVDRRIIQRSIGPPPRSDDEELDFTPQAEGIIL